jgi:hypothetical protein
MNNSSLNNLCGNGDFSHVYIIVHYYLDLQNKIQKRIKSFYE